MKIILLMTAIYLAAYSKYSVSKPIYHHTYVFEFVFSDGEIQRDTLEVETDKRKVKFCLEDYCFLMCKSRKEKKVISCDFDTYELLSHKTIEVKK